MPALCPISWSCCGVLTTMSASRWRAWSLVQKFYKSVFFWDTLYVLFFVCDFLTFLCFTSSNFQFKVFLPEYSRNLTCLVLLGPGSFFRISLIGSDQLWKFCPICEKSDRGNIRTKEMINKTNRGIISYLQLIFAILDDISFNFIYLTLVNLWIQTNLLKNEIVLRLPYSEALCIPTFEYRWEVIP